MDFCEVNSSFVKDLQCMSVNGNNVIWDYRLRCDNQFLTFLCTSQLLLAEIWRFGQWEA